MNAPLATPGKFRDVSWQDAEVVQQMARDLGNLLTLCWRGEDDTCAAGAFKAASDNAFSIARKIGDLANLGEE